MKNFVERIKVMLNMSWRDVKPEEIFGDDCIPNVVL